MSKESSHSAMVCVIANQDVGCSCERSSVEPPVLLKGGLSGLLVTVDVLPG